MMAKSLLQRRWWNTFGRCVSWSCCFLRWGLDSCVRWGGRQLLRGEGLAQRSVVCVQGGLHHQEGNRTFQWSFSSHCHGYSSWRQENLSWAEHVWSFSFPLILLSENVVWRWSRWMLQNTHRSVSSVFFFFFCCFTEIRVPLIQTELLGSKVPGTDHQTIKHHYCFLSEINR